MPNLARTAWDIRRAGRESRRSTKQLSSFGFCASPPPEDGR